MTDPRKDACSEKSSSLELGTVDKPERPTCATCPFWHSGEDDEDGSVPLGQCRRHSPRLILGMSEYAMIDMATDGKGCFEHQHSRKAVWPITRYWDWCGEHPDFQRTAPQPKIIFTGGVYDEKIEGSVSTRVQNALEREGICTIGHLMEASVAKLVLLRDMGSVRVAQVQEMLRKKGLTLAE